MKVDYPIISADSHITEAPDTYVGYIDAAWREKAPRIVSTPDHGDIFQIHGNIYLGKVQNVLPGMEAAFVDIGKGRNAVLYAGLPVIERQPHDSVLPYIRPGMDSTVWYGDTTTTADDTDMKFRNNSDGYVLIEQFVSDDGYMYANVYGVPNNIEVEMYSEPVWENANGAEWVTYYTRYKNGEVVYEDSWNSEYTALYDDEGKKIPTTQVPVAEIDGSYLGPSLAGG